MALAPPAIAWTLLHVGRPWDGSLLHRVLSLEHLAALSAGAAHLPSPSEEPIYMYARSRDPLKVA